MSNTILAFRDPYEYVKNEILMVGFPDGEDQPFMDKVDTLEQDDAFLLASVVAHEISQGIPLTQVRVAKLLSDTKEYAPYLQTHTIH